LLSQVALNLGKCLLQISLITGKECTTTGSLRYFSQRSFFDVERVAVANANRVDKRVDLLRVLNRFVHLHPATGVLPVG
jgi:hypothetical protein